MNKEQGVIGIIVLVIAVILAGGIYYVSLNQQGVFNSFASAAKTNIANQAQISITAKGFVPQVLSVKKGTQITWTNNDNKAYQIYSDPHPTHTSLSELSSGRLKQNESYSFTFEKTGTFTYHSEFNPLKFYGTVVVK